MSGTRTHPWIVFTALSLLFFLVSAGTFNSLGVVLPAMVHALSWNWTQAGLGYTVLGLSCGLSSVIVAASVRRLGVRITLTIGGVLLTAGFAALALAHGIWAYLAGTLMIGAGFTFSATVPGNQVLTGIFRRRSTVIGAYFTIGALGAVAGPLIYLLVEWLGGWRAFWWTLAAASVVLAAFAIVVTPNRVDDAPRDDGAEGDLGGWTVAKALATPQFYVIVGGYTMFLLINTTAHGFAVEHLLERGVSKAAGAGMLSAEALVAAAVSLIGGVAGETVKPKTLLIVCLASIVVGMCALAAAHGYGLMAVFSVGVGIGYGLSYVSTNMLLLTWFGRGVYLELYSIMCLISTSAAIGPAVGGWARDRFGGFSAMFYLCAALALLFLIATLFMRMPRVRAAGRVGGTSARTA